MKKLSSKIGAVMLATILVFTLSPASALADDQGQLQAGTVSMQAQDVSMEAQAVDPAKANDAVGKFTDALSKFYTDTSEMSKVSSFLTRFGGLTSAASGAIGILQILGIVKDPTQVALAQILDAVNNMKLQLNQRMRAVIVQKTIQTGHTDQETCQNPYNHHNQILNPG